MNPRRTPLEQKLGTFIRMLASERDGEVVAAARATQPFISIVGHITIDELRQILDHTSMTNGYANRYLFTCAP